MIHVNQWWYKIMNDTWYDTWYDTSYSYIKKSLILPPLITICAKSQQPFWAIWMACKCGMQQPFTRKKNAATDEKIVPTNCLPEIKMKMQHIRFVKLMKLWTWLLIACKTASTGASHPPSLTWPGQFVVATTGQDVEGIAVEALQDFGGCAHTQSTKHAWKLTPLKTVCDWCFTRKAWLYTTIESLAAWSAGSYSINLFTMATPTSNRTLGKAGTLGATCRLHRWSQQESVQKSGCSLQLNEWIATIRLHLWQRSKFTFHDFKQPDLQSSKQTTTNHGLTALWNRVVTSSDGLALKSSWIFLGDDIETFSSLSIPTN